VDVFGRHVSWPALSVCGLVILVGALAVGVVGFGLAPWLILMGAFCVAMMGSMLWMMVAMGKNTSHRR
jgi:hypothetical protein